MAAVMSCISPCVICCISCNFAFGGRSATLLMDHGMMSCLMFGATQDEGEDEVDVCALCCQKRSTITGCCECQEHYCDECIDAHNCGENVVY